MQYNTDFIYYSFDFNLITPQQASGGVILSADVCQECLDAYAERIKANYKPSQPSKVFCDISGEQIAGPYYLCKISKVAVQMSNKQFECSKCHSPIGADKKCGKCADGVAIRHANVDVDEDFLEVNFSNKMFVMFKQHIDKMKLVGDTSWQTKTS
jgi:hypothetical protein